MGRGQIKASGNDHERSFNLTYGGMRTVCPALGMACPSGVFNSCASGCLSDSVSDTSEVALRKKYVSSAISPSSVWFRFLYRSSATYTTWKLLLSFENER